MDEVTIPSEIVPSELKAGCEQILKRAKELKKAEPIVAYWCCFSAAQKALAMKNRSAEATKFLLTLLDSLEQMKAVLDTQDAVITEAAGAAYIENFALKVFMSADNDDRSGNTGKATIRKFVVAGQFIEVLRCFENGMTEEMEQKLQYARWKAADGAKALREGRTPVSGPPIPEEEDLLPNPAAGSPVTDTVGFDRPLSPPEAEAATGSGSPPNPIIISPKPSPPSRSRPTLPDIDIAAPSKLRTPTRTQSGGSGAWSTVATPGLPDDEDEQRRFEQPSAPPLDQSDDTPPLTPPVGGEKKNVRFMGPDGAPLSPAQTFFTTSSYDDPIAPPPTTIAPSPTSPERSPPDSRSRGESGSVHDLPKPTSLSNPSTAPSSRPLNNITNGSGPVPINNNNRGRSGSSARYSPNLPSTSSIPPPPPPSLASAANPAIPPQHAPTSNELGLTSGPAAVPSRKQVDQAQKHAKWAISALDYDDYDTARSELRKALAMIGG